MKTGTQITQMVMIDADELRAKKLFPLSFPL
jgi:hypothetical protein